MRTNDAAHYFHSLQMFYKLRKNSNPPFEKCTNSHAYHHCLVQNHHLNITRTYQAAVAHPLPGVLQIKGVRNHPTN